jgi:hypothetical protein
MDSHPIAPYHCRITLKRCGLRFGPASQNRSKNKTNYDSNRKKCITHSNKTNYYLLFQTYRMRNMQSGDSRVHFLQFVC